jgi:propionate CoA-transferase
VITLYKQIQVEDLVRDIPDGSTIALLGFGGMGQCDKILKSIGEHFLRTGHPRNLTVFHTAGQSNRFNGIEYIAEEGLVTRVIGGHWGLAPRMQKLIEENKVDCYCFPQGQLTHLLRTIANKLPGQISPIGLGTFVDPRIEGGKFNERTRSKENLVEMLTIGNDDFLFYKAVKFDYVFIRGTTIDENGHITTEEEPLKLELLSGAQAAKACGGKVIAQVKYIAQKESFHPKDVVVPGYLVDAFVLADKPEQEHRQVFSSAYHPVYSGDIRTPASVMPSIPFGIRKIVGRRAVKELKPLNVVNLGIGIPGDVIGPIVIEEGLDHHITLTVESGIVGGVPAGVHEFGVARNAEAILNHEAVFDYYHGTGIDITFMGAAEVDRHGNVNVSKFGSKSVGCGGFIDITQPAKKVVFCTTFTGGTTEFAVDERGLQIITDGTIKKFVNEVNQITFSGPYAAAMGQEVIYVTERAVFTLTTKGLVLTEIAPGADLERDVLDRMDFRPILDPDMKEMDRGLFLP